MRFGAGETLHRAGDRCDGAILLLEGELARIRDGRILTIERAPALLALADAAGEEAEFGDTWRAERAGAAATVPLADLGAETVQRLLVAECRAAWATQSDLVESFDDFWSSPNAELVPGPYEFGPFGAVFVAVRTQPEALDALLPRGVRRLPGMGGIYFLSLSFLENCRAVHAPEAGSWSYEEVTPLVPVLTKRGKVGSFIPELYPDAYMATILGREIYGFPKRVARAQKWDDGLDLLVGGERLMRARWGGGKPTSTTTMMEELRETTAPVLPDSSVEIGTKLFGLYERLGGRPHFDAFLHRRLLDYRSERPGDWSTDELVAVRFDVTEFEARLRFDRIDLEFASTQSILSGEPLAAWAVTTGFRFGRARRLQGASR